MPTASRAAHVGIVSRRGAAVPRVTRSLSRGRNSRAPIDGQSWSRAVSSRSGDARAALNPLTKRRRPAGRSRGMTDRSVATSGMGEGVWAVDIACMLETGHGVKPEGAGRHPYSKGGRNDGTARGAGHVRRTAMPRASHCRQAAVGGCAVASESANYVPYDVPTWPDSSNCRPAMRPVVARFCRRDGPGDSDGGVGNALGSKSLQAGGANSSG